MDSMIARSRRRSSWQLWEWEKVLDKQEREAERKERNDKIFAILNWCARITVLFCGILITVKLYKFFAVAPNAWTTWHVVFLGLAVFFIDQVSGGAIFSAVHDVAQRIRHVSTKPDPHQGEMPEPLSPSSVKLKQVLPKLPTVQEEDADSHNSNNTAEM